MTPRWLDGLPDHPGEWFKVIPNVKQPVKVLIVDINGSLMEYAKGRFWDLRVEPDKRWFEIIPDVENPI